MENLKKKIIKVEVTLSTVSLEFQVASKQIRSDISVSILLLALL